MVKNKLLVALAAVSSLGFSVATSAQSGLTSQWSAVYLGFQGGWGKTDYDANEFRESLIPTVPKDSIRQEGLAGRAYIGYQYNQYLALETGFSGFSKIKFKKDSVGADIGDIQTTQWDLLLKVGTPFGCSGFRGDIKLGAAYVMPFINEGDSAVLASADDDTVNNDDTVNGPDSDRHDSVGNGLRVVAGASLTYSFWNNFSVDLSYLHTFSDPDGGEGRIGVPSIDLATFGISYLFPPVEALGW